MESARNVSHLHAPLVTLSCSRARPGQELTQNFRVLIWCPGSARCANHFVFSHAGHNGQQHVGRRAAAQGRFEVVQRREMLMGEDLLEEVALRRQHRCAVDLGALGGLRCGRCGGRSTSPSASHDLLCCRMRRESLQKTKCGVICSQFMCNSGRNAFLTKIST